MLWPEDVRNKYPIKLFDAIIVLVDDKIFEVLTPQQLRIPGFNFSEVETLYI